MLRLDPTASAWAPPRTKREYEGSWVEASATQLKFNAPTASPENGWTVPIGRDAGQAGRIVHCTGRNLLMSPGGGASVIDRYLILDDLGSCLATLPGRDFDGPGGYMPERVEAFATAIGLPYSELRLQTANQARVYPGLMPHQGLYSFFSYLFPILYVICGLMCLTGVVLTVIQGLNSAWELLALLPFCLFGLLFLGLATHRWPKSYANLTARSNRQ